ncbi:fluoride efflux transporter CrcB [Evansella tamaricis]|uniref:Fluoride-specific ion channel FluC n=1 Tax=Evansella tamaricis TaxID=2069301 RepID=A0ABS6JF59_9BACI|nr:fluoride efflux transporter CrcB [Evansella tamaricis]MBU9712307.1 fluoride efflux transporter CrcB [Evansella tamaricis]
MNVLLVGLGGAVGAVARYLLGVGIMKKFPHPPIPIAMLVVNVTGSFGLGIFFAIAYGVIPLASYDAPLFLLIGIGFFGAFTTFSTFSIETIQLINEKLIKKAILYFCLSIFGSIVTFLMGFSLALLI